MSDFEGLMRGKGIDGSFFTFWGGIHLLAALVSGFGNG